MVTWFSQKKSIYARHCVCIIPVEKIQVFAFITGLTKLLKEKLFLGALKNKIRSITAAIFWGKKKKFLRTYTIIVAS